MRFEQLAHIGSEYRNEVGTHGHRNDPGAWFHLETLLKEQITELRALQPLERAADPGPFRAGMSVAQLRAIHMNAQHNAQDQSRIARCKAKIAYYREWLHREGVTADADGNVCVMNANGEPTGLLPGAVQQLTVVYDDDPILRKAQKVHFAGGRMFCDAACTSPLTTKDMVTHFSGPGFGAYVMSAKGSVYVGSHVVGHHHHSSLKCGKPVACAGEVQVRGGVLHAITNKSGHYLPTEEHLVQVLALLHKRGVAPVYRVGVVNPAKSIVQWHANPDAYAARRGMNIPVDFELTKLMWYNVHLKDSVLSRNGWRMHNPDKGEKFGVYTISSNSPVSHSEVRKWLKSQGLTPKANYVTG